MTDTIQLQVVEGDLARSAQLLYGVTRDLPNLKTLLSSCTDLLNESKKMGSRRTSSVEKNVSGTLERDAIAFAQSRRESMEARFLGDDLFSEYMEARNRVVGDERDARRRLGGFNVTSLEQADRQRIYGELQQFYQFCSEKEPMWRKTAKQAAQKNEEHMMSPQFVHERFTVEELANDKMRRMLDEHSDFLYSLRIVESDERAAAMERTRVRCQESIRLSTVSQGSYLPPNRQGGAYGNQYPQQLPPSYHSAGPYSGVAPQVQPQKADYRQWEQPPRPQPQNPAPGQYPSQNMYGAGYPNAYPQQAPQQSYGFQPQNQFHAL